MKYFSIYTPDPKTNPVGPLTPAQKEEMDRFVAAAIERGEFLGGGGFLPLKEHGAIVRRADGVSRVIDGPYAEAREIVGGFAMAQYASREAAIEGARRFMEIAGDGECVTYAISDDPDAC